MKKVIIVLLFLFLINLCLAFPINEISEDNIIVSEFSAPAKFTLDMDVPQNDSGSYHIYSLADVDILPASNFIVSPGKNQVKVEIYPTERLNVKGFYTFAYTMKREDDFKVEDRITLKIVDFKNFISINSDTNEFGKDTLSFYIENTEKKKLENINVRFSSIFFEVNEKITINPLGKTVITVPVDQEKLKRSLAGSYLVTGYFETDKGVVDIDGKLYIGEKKGIKTEELKSGVLIRNHAITKINVGNVPDTVNFKIKKDFISRIFVTLSEDPDLVEREGIFIIYSWNKKLAPSDSYTIKVKTNYLLPFLILLFGAIAVGWVKYKTRRDVEVVKSVSHMKTKGGEFALKVKIKIKAKKAVENLALVDKIPAIVKLYDKHTTEGMKIDYANRRLQWNLGDLGAGEERDVSYIVYSKIGIVGKFSLPEALAVFEENGEVKESESNNVFFLSEQTHKDEFVRE